MSEMVWVGPRREPESAFRKELSLTRCNPCILMYSIGNVRDETVHRLATLNVDRIEWS